jgi:hypothetical protein
MIKSTQCPLSLASLPLLSLSLLATSRWGPVRFFLDQRGNQAGAHPAARRRRGAASLSSSLSLSLSYYLSEDPKTQPSSYLRPGNAADGRRRRRLSVRSPVSGRPCIRLGAYVGERLGRLLRYDLQLHSSIATAPDLLLGEPLPPPSTTQRPRRRYIVAVKTACSPRLISCVGADPDRPMLALPKSAENQPSFFFLAIFKSKLLDLGLEIIHYIFSEHANFYIQNSTCFWIGSLSSRTHLLPKLLLYNF